MTGWILPTLVSATDGCTRFLSQQKAGLGRGVGVGGGVGGAIAAKGWARKGVGVGGGGCNSSKGLG